MVTKTIRVSDEDWKAIEKELNESGLSFADFARNRLMQKNQNENLKTDLIDFSEIVKVNCKTLDTQVAKYISVLLEKLEKQEKRFNKFLEEKAFVEFTVVATREEKEKVEDINFYRVGDILENDVGFRSVILKIDRENEIFTLTPYPILEEKYYIQDSTVDLRGRVLKYLKRVLRLKKD